MRHFILFVLIGIILSGVTFAQAGDEISVND